MADVLRVVGTVAGIGGLALGVLLLVYRDFIRDFIRQRAFRTMSSGQATILLGATIVLTFAIAVLGVFAGFAAGAGAVSFIVLVALLLLFVVAVLVIVTRRGGLGGGSGGGPPHPDDRDAFERVVRMIDTGRPDEADRILSQVAPTRQGTANFWYWKARVAFARDNLDVASVYTDEALKRDAVHPHGTALKIELLLLSTKRGDRKRARELADRSYGITEPLDVWLKCLTAEGMFTPGLRVRSELDTKCPFPAYTFPED